MGTRGTVHWNEICTLYDRATGEFKTKEKNLLNVYNHWDSYPEGLGRELAEFISQHTIVNGISINETRKVANGFDDLCLLWLCEHKNGKVGSVYATTEDCDLEEYNYWITDNCDVRGIEISKHLITIKCVNWDDELVYDGTPEDWLEFVKKLEERKC